MITQIVIHLMPYEIDFFEWQIKQLKQGSLYLDKEDEIIIDVTLNLNLVNWNKSSIPSSFFETKFKQIEELCDWCETNFVIDKNNNCLGCDDKRRDSIRASKSDNILYLDTDIIFKPELLKYIIDSSKQIDNEYYIISPQVTRLWDNSWDILVNNKHLNRPPSQQYKEICPFEIINTPIDEIYLKDVDDFKFGGGWFNLLSTNLLKLTDIPDSFGPYGVDDTYVMYCCNLLKHNKYNIKQYTLDGLLVAENIKYGNNPYKDYLYLIDKKDEFRRKAEANLSIEIVNFKEKI